MSDQPPILLHADTDETPPLRYPPERETVRRVGINRRVTNLNNFELTEIERLQNENEQYRVFFQDVRVIFLKAYEQMPVFIQEKLEVLKSLLERA